MITIHYNTPERTGVIRRTISPVPAKKWHKKYIGGCKYVDYCWYCCEPTVKNKKYCKEHIDIKCVRCGKQATNVCDAQVVGLMCGAKLCNSCDGCNKHKEKEI